MKAVAILFASVLLAASSAEAHTYVSRIVYGGQNYTSNLRAMPDSSVRNAPVTDVTSQDFVCNTARPGPASAPLTVSAGSAITFRYVHEVDAVPTSGDNIIGGWGSHKGPCNVYAAPLSTVSYSGTTNWVKIWSYGWTSANGWCTDLIVNSGGYLTITLPANMAAGQWVLRTEFLALHNAYATAGAQFYVQCYDFTVTSSYSGTPSPTTKIPGHLTASDPGVLINIYGGDGQICGTSAAAQKDCSWYVVPGPAVATWSGSAAAASSTTRTTTTTTRTTTTSAAAAATGACQVKWAQCGGISWTGSTTCCSGSVCTYGNDYYSQCI